MVTNDLVTSKPQIHPIGAKPLTIKDGSVAVKIYGTWSHSKKTDSVSGKKIKNFKPEYTLRYYLCGEKYQRRFTDLNKAKLEAKSVLTKLRNNETESLKLTGLDRSSYVEAQSMLSSLDGSPSLLSAINEYVVAKKHLSGSELRLVDVVKEHSRRISKIEKPIKVSSLVAEFLAFKEKQNLSSEYMRTLRRLKTFGDDFDVNVNELNFDILQTYFEHMVDGSGNPAQPRTKRNAWERVITLLRFGLKRKYLSSELVNDLLDVDLPKIIEGKLLIWTPDEFKEMLNSSRDSLVPYLTIAGFAGVRTQEIHNLDWSQIDLVKKQIKINNHQAKTRSRRIVPLCDAAVSWLELHQKDNGKVVHYADPGKHSKSILKDVRDERSARGDSSDFKWKRNGLRHSFISYRLADTKKVHELAMDAGNSEDIIFKNYRELVTEDEAKAWFSIYPDSEKNIIQLRSINQ